MTALQVTEKHYKFSSYVNIKRFSSYFYQVREVLDLAPTNVLEVGGGAGIFRSIVKAYVDDFFSLDVDAALGPDLVGSIDRLPFQTGSFDVVVAFQVLEHLPYRRSLLGFSECMRISRRAVVISLPDGRPKYRFVIHVPKAGEKTLIVNRPTLRKPVHTFDGEHYWELQTRGYSYKDVASDFCRVAGDSTRLLRTYQVPENPNHRFFVFVKDA